MFDSVGKVDIYFNLHKKVFSVKCRSRGIVIAHARTVLCADHCDFVVRPAGNVDAVESGVKNVHAFVRAPNADIWSDFRPGLAKVAAENALFQRVSYNSQKGPHFYRVGSGKPIHGAPAGVLMVCEKDMPLVYALRK